MAYYLILARSVTYAQRMQRALDRAGISSRIFRAPRELTDLGCAYALKLAVKDLREALMVLHREGLDPIQIFLFQRGLYQEVEPGMPYHDMEPGRPHWEPDKPYRDREPGRPYRDMEPGRPYRDGEPDKPYREVRP